MKLQIKIVVKHCFYYNAGHLDEGVCSVAYVVQQACSIR